jgi:O-antigen ligase
LTLERAQLALVAAMAAVVPVSIFATQLLGALAAVVFAARLLRGRVRFPRTPLDAPILAFCLWTLLSASFSADPAYSHEEAKKLLLFFILYLGVDAMASETGRERIVTVVLLGGLALSGLTIVQYFLLGFDTLNLRPRGFLGHYMSASGLIMGMVVLAAARLALARDWRPHPLDGRLLAGLAGAVVLVALALAAGGRPGVLAVQLFVLGLAVTGGALAVRRQPWPGAATGVLTAAATVALGSAALVLSQTRNAWLGLLAGLAAVAAVSAPRSLWLLGAGLLAVLATRPAPVMNRLTIVDDSTRDRYYMWQAGIDMILDKPVFGQGPGMIVRVYPRYRWQEAPNPLAPHLHNNALQLAAERGLPVVVLWLWLMAAVMGDAWREARAHRGVAGASARPAWPAVGAMGVLVATLGAGMFEYNFGDSEVLMFVLLVAGLPYALRRQRALLAGEPA